MTYNTIAQWQAQLSEEFNELRPNLLKIQKIIESIAALEADLLVNPMSVRSELLIDIMSSKSLTI